MKWRFRAKRGITSSPTIDKHNGFSVPWMELCMPSIKKRLGRSGGSVWARDRSLLPVLSMILSLLARQMGLCMLSKCVTSKELWRYRTEHQVSSSPVVYKDSLYCGSVDGPCIVLSIVPVVCAGSLDRRSITGSPLVYDDIVYVGSTDHQVYALLA
jgi:eukaryotic-like serine/threonine-protein kinase